LPNFDSQVKVKSLNSSNTGTQYTSITWNVIGLSIVLTRIQDKTDLLAMNYANNKAAVL